MRTKSRSNIFDRMVSEEHEPPVSLGSGRQAKNRNRPGWSWQILAAALFSSRALAQVSGPGGPLGTLAGYDKIAMSIPRESMKFRLSSGDHGRFSGGVRQPIRALTLSLDEIRSGGKMW